MCLLVNLRAILGAYIGVKREEYSISGDAGAYIEFNGAEHPELLSGIAVVMTVGTGGTSILDLALGVDINDPNTASFDPNKSSVLTFQKLNSGQTLRITKNYVWANVVYLTVINPRYIL